MTLDGTNTWVLREPGGRSAVVVDPGPEDGAHLARVAAFGPIAAILLTHGHADHSGGARRFSEITGAPVRALDPRHRYGGEGLAEGDLVAVDGLELRVIATPGHSADSLCFALPADRAVLTGDTVLGRGTSVVAYPDGRLGDYLGSIRRLRALADDGVDVLLPGHGPVVSSAASVLDFYLAHRAERLAQVQAAVDAGVREPAAVVRQVYADVDPSLWPAAELSVRAQLDYLEGHRRS
ncbi:MAG TPA: MBL fold metallo-hydrolase [Mycobacteriales bacterium]|nr:MBL fold metallo-hydrolase [Mycobacteriales bacterium]